MQRYRHYGASCSASSPSSAAVEEADAEEEDELLREEGVEDVVQETGAVNEEEVVPQKKEEVTPAASETEAKVPPVETKNGKKTEGGGGEGGGPGPKYSMFTWFVVLALLGVWSSVAVVYFDIVDYDSVIARAQEFRMNFSEVLQGKLTAYDTDGDGDFDVEDAKVLLGKSHFYFYSFAHRGPVRGLRLRSALKEELRMIHEKMEAKRIARIALAEIRAFLAEEEEEKEAAWALKMETLEAAQEQLREERRKEERRREVEKEKEIMEKEKAEKERMEKEKEIMEKAEKEKERMEKEIMEKEKAEKERMEMEKAKKEKERMEKEIMEKEKAEKERMEMEKAEKESMEKAEKERMEREKAEKEKMEKERKEKTEKERERLERERAEKERMEREVKEKAERERLARERVEKERQEVERLAREERERLERQKMERERLVREKEAKERLEKERLAKEKADKERIERERVAKERERIAKEKERVERERLEKERVEKERIAKERAEKERLERERVAKERERVAREKERQEKERIAKENAEKERMERAKAEKERERAEKERLEKERQAREKERMERERIAKERARVAQEKERSEREKAAKAEKERAEKEERERISRQKECLYHKCKVNQSPLSLSLCQGKAEEALRAFETLVQQFPQSPRARYGRAQAEDDLAEKQRSNDMLQRAINSYKEAAELPDVTSDLLRAALKRRAERQQFLGRMRGSLATLERLVQIFPEDVSLKNDLGVAHLLLGDNKGAKRVYEEVLAAAPGNGFAKVHYGFILKSENKIPESIPYLRDGLESGEPGTDDGRFYFHLGDALQRVGDDSAYHWYELGHRRGHFASVWQRSLYNVEGLKAQPWWTPTETGYSDLVKTLERNWKTIRDEALAVMDQNTGLFIPEEENLREKGEWGQHTLWQQGRKVGTSCQGVPKTCSLLERYPEATGCKRGQIKFSVMQPGTHVWPHTGPTNCRLRMHLGLVVPPHGCRIRCTNQTRCRTNLHRHPPLFSPFFVFKKISTCHLLSLVFCPLVVFIPP
uniref:Aspartyl/asparaginyl beta-hydroxylase-like n=1 Tax=Scophthalmus maximus TaxID=52904 RepID=A0A8D3D792_SCOMX